MQFLRGLSIAEMGVLVALVLAVIIGAAVVFNQINNSVSDEDFETVATSAFERPDPTEIALTLTAAAPLIQASETAAAEATAAAPQP